MKENACKSYTSSKMSFGQVRFQCNFYILFNLMTLSISTLINILIKSDRFLYFIIFYDINNNKECIYSLAIVSLHAILIYIHIVLFSYNN